MCHDRSRLFPGETDEKKEAHLFSKRKSLVQVYLELDPLVGESGRTGQRMNGSFSVQLGKQKKKTLRLGYKLLVSFVQTASK